MKTWQFVAILLCVFALDIHLTLIIRPHFKEQPDTEVWFCLTWMALITESGLGLIWYQLNHKVNKIK